MMSMNDMNNPILSYFFSFSSFYCRFSIVQNGSVFRIFHVEHTDIIIVYREKKSIFPFGNCAWSAPYIIRISMVTVFCISVCKVISNSWCRNRPHSRVCFFSAFYSYKKKHSFAIEKVVDKRSGAHIQCEAELLSSFCSLLWRRRWWWWLRSTTATATTTMFIEKWTREHKIQLQKRFYLWTFSSSLIGALFGLNWILFASLSWNVGPCTMNTANLFHWNWS